MEEYGNVKALIDVMNANGVEHVFFNPGIDNVPVLEMLSACRARGEPAPAGILCLDEFVAMTAAHGNYMASGRPQVVSVHSELGTLQLGGSLHNAQWGRVPVVFFTETQGPPQRTDWCGDTFDQGKMVRNFVKWDHCLSHRRCRAVRSGLSEPAAGGALGQERRAERQGAIAGRPRGRTRRR
jgi:acetolactate synthase-1/2/3 large subunit